jgi:hypothetical protein
MGIVCLSYCYGNPDIVACVLKEMGFTYVFDYVWKISVLILTDLLEIA